MSFALALVIVDFVVGGLLFPVEMNGSSRAIEPPTECVFRLDEESPKFPAHLIDPDTMQVINPVLVGEKRIIKLSVGQRLTAACEGPNNILLRTEKQFNAACCCHASPKLQVTVGNSTASLQLAYNELGCKSQPKESFIGSGTCGGGVGSNIRIGWQFSAGAFIDLYTVCHDKSNSNTLYSVNTIRGASVLADDESNKRPSFRESGFYPGMDVNKAYSQTGQKALLTKILGSVGASYIDVAKNLFFSRGHLAPDGDFIDAASQDATYYYINAAPQWQSFNNGNWKAVETSVRNLAAQRKVDYTVYTGTFGTLTLADADGQQQPIYLTTDVNNNGLIPVPKFYWKLVHDPETKTATAVVGLNNPHLTMTTPIDRTSGDIFFCPDVCGQVAWLQNVNHSNIRLGLTFCCTADELRRAIPHVPDLGILPLLI